MEEHKFDKKIEDWVGNIVVTNEYSTAKRNSQGAFEDFESYVDLFDAERSEKDYDWMSDIFIPEFPTHMLVQSAEDVAQYFRTRDFVETYVTDKSPRAIKAAESAEELLNTSLNRRELYHYQKYVRAKTINRLAGEVWAHCWWEQKVSRETVGEDEQGKKVYDEKILKDYFNYEILDPRNVFIVDGTYSYSAQQKKAVIIRCERTYEDLLGEKKSHKYFNLDIVKDLKRTGETETKTEIEDENKQRPGNKIDEPFDKLIRYGLFWFKGTEPGLDENGNVLEDAVLKEAVLTFIKSGSDTVLIGFRAQPYKDANGNAYKPLIRGLCYVHPTRDSGVGDAKYSSELQIAINDTFNLNNDRTRLATMPTMKGKKYVTEDADEIYFEPGHVMDLEDPNDLVEFQISDNIQGGLAQLGILTEKMREASSTYPPQMGNVPEVASTTATAIASATSGSSRRSNMQSMTFENTFLAELYWMDLQMTWQFAKPETGFKLMGAKVYDFEPNFEYYFRPLSQSIETDQAKQAKIQKWQGILQVVVQLQHPDTVKMVNYILKQIATLMGDEFESFADKLLDEGQPIESGGNQAPQAGGPPVSNQNVIEMSSPEISSRESANG